MATNVSGPIIPQPVNVPEIKKEKRINLKRKVRLPSRKVLIGVSLFISLGLGLIGLLFIAQNGTTKISSVLGLNTNSTQNKNPTIANFIQNLFNPQKVAANNPSSEADTQPQSKLYTNRMLKYSINLPSSWVLGKRVGGRLDDYLGNEFELTVSLLEQSCDDSIIPSTGTKTVSRVLQLASGQNITFEETDDVKTGSAYCGIASVTNETKTLYIKYLKDQGEVNLDFGETVLPIVSKINLN